MELNSKIKVNVVTGFLGAGKTTFINQLLKRFPEIQFALVENEFGDVSIDSKLIKGVDASQMFELKQGCICCTVSDEFELVLQELAERFANVEHLLIETTGLADPAQVIRPFFINPDLKEIYQFNGTICLVGGADYENLPEKELALKQLLVSDLVAVSKTEEFSDEQKAKLKSIVQKQNPFAGVIFAEKDCLPDIQLNSILKKTKTEFDYVGFSNLHPAVSSKTLRFRNPLNKAAFLRWLEYTLDIYKKQIYRAKGILCFEDEAYQFVLQGVGGSFELVESDLILEQPETTLVFIGKLDGVDLDCTF